jgi:hypothetical protein
MTSFIPGKTLGRLMLISAGILLHANGALAAKFVSDPQMQASDLLSGTVGGRAKITDESSAVPDEGRNAVNPDPQQQARQMILGTPKSAGIADRAVDFDSKTKVTPPDGQESARRMLLGTEGRLT